MVATAEPAAGPAFTGGIAAEDEPCRLIYYSTISERLTRAGLKAILMRSRDNNRRIGVTGALCLTDRHFLQILEGRRAALNRLFTRIAADPRHRDVTIIAFIPDAERVFPDWSMLFMGADPATRAACQRFCASPVLRPERLTADMAVALLGHLAALTRNGPTAAGGSGGTDGQP
ncbi:BLUF domain-containing protein [Azospirillum halopraeferens]|uniref:BLUF domain-containing protein n=1 Tax=Azospirillum halopraeferens TaxID=34010 RepID=UPI00040D2878|nr:BLUF domain-containing protein [Azospirillum halopraeferens]